MTNLAQQSDTVEILVVEDSPTQAEQLKHTLEGHGFRVTVATNGNEALALIAQRRPTLVISDIVMPVMDGYQLCRKIKEDEALRGLPVILLTALSDPRDVISGLECGADNFMTKPFDEKHILSRIQFLLANMQLRETEKTQLGVEVILAGERHYIKSDRIQILNLLLSSYEAAFQRNRELIHTQSELAETVQALEDANHELLVLNQELEQRRAEAEESRFEAVAANRAKSNFLATMSHELRTPLNSVLGFSEILEDELYGQLNDKQKEYIRNIHLSGRHLLNLINDILDLSKVEAGKMELEITRFRLRGALDISMIMLREKAMQHNISMSLEVEPPADGEIEADERKLKQILFNLISNAVKFTPDGGAVRVSARLIRGSQVEVRGDQENVEPQTSNIEPDRNFVEISVEDTGIGIKAEDLPRLFTPFVQLESGCERRYEGTGLGLALTSRMVKLHGGSIRVESEFGKGSRFSFVIPVRHIR